MEHKTTAEIVDRILKEYKDNNIKTIGIHHIQMNKFSYLSHNRFHEIEDTMINHNIIEKIDSVYWNITPIGEKVMDMGYNKWILKQEDAKVAPNKNNKLVLIGIIVTAIFGIIGAIITLYNLYNK